MNHSAQGSLFDKVLEPSNLFSSYKRARSGIQDKTDANIMEAGLEREVFDLRERLASESYIFGPYQCFLIRDPKERYIHVAPFRDRVIHHAINAVIEPIFDRSFIFHSFACRKGKGNRAAILQMQRWLDGDPTAYVLTLDIRKFFPSIDRDILLRQLHSRINDAKLMRLLERLVTSAPGLIYPGKGLPIGNLTSQTFANLYMNDLDHYAKDYLGIRRYMRYVDDIICIGPKAELHEQRLLLKEFVERRLNLAIAPHKDKVLSARNGISYLGFVLRPNQRPKLRKQAIKRFFWNLRRARKGGLSDPDIATKLASWYAHAKLANVDFLLKTGKAEKYVEGLRQIEEKQKKKREIRNGQEKGRGSTKGTVTEARSAAAPGTMEGTPAGGC